MKVELCKLDEIPETGSKIVSFFGRELHVYKTNGKPRAVANVCMHFGGPLECQDDQFVCPWHNAAFSMDTGERLEGPAPAKSRLLFLSTVIEDGALHYIWGD